MMCVLSVFAPSFFMAGVGRQLFVPLSLAVGFAMVSSYLLSSTLVPVLSTWIMRQFREESHGRSLYSWALERLVRMRWLVAGGYTVAALLLLVVLLPRLPISSACSRRAIR
jgi:multidrug efflux pump subunit AcrB